MIRKNKRQLYNALRSGNVAAGSRDGRLMYDFFSTARTSQGYAVQCCLVSLCFTSTLHLNCFKNQIYQSLLKIHHSLCHEHVKNLIFHCKRGGNSRRV
jgi:hypothetical protein